MQHIKKLTSILLVAILLAGCSSQSRKIIAQDAKYGAGIGALPGVVLFGLTDAVESESTDKSAAQRQRETDSYTFSLEVLCIGTLGGLVAGTIVGVIHSLMASASEPDVKYDENYDPNKQP